MKFSKFALSLLLLIVLTPGTSAQLASAATASCKSINEVRTISGKDMLCAKSAGKLIWKTATFKFPKIEFNDFEPIPDGFSLQIKNLNKTLKVSLSTTSGEVLWDDSGIITITGDLNPNGSLSIKGTSGKYFRTVVYSGEAFSLKQLPSPLLSSYIKQNDDGIDVELLNYDQEKYWEIDSNLGSASIDSTGLISVFNVYESGPVSFTLRVSADGYKSLTKEFKFEMPSFAVKPSLGVIENKTSNSFSFAIQNYSPTYAWKVTTSEGQVQVSNSGQVVISNLSPNSPANISVTASKDGYISQTTEITGSALPTFFSISERDWALIAKNPSGNAGRHVIIYGYITQFDAATGLDQFRADVNGINARYSYGFTGENTFLIGNALSLRNFVAKDYFTAKVIVKGVKTYTTTLNGSISVPLLEIIEISRS